MIIMQTFIRTKEDIMSPFQILYRLDLFIILTFLSLFIKTIYVNRVMTMTVSQGSVLASTSVLLLILSVAILLEKKWRVTYLIFANTFISLLLFADLLYFRYFGSPITMYIFLQSSNLKDLGPSILSLIRPYDIFLFLDIIISLFLSIFLNIRQPIFSKKFLIFTSIFLTGLFLLSLKPLKIYFLDQRDPFKKFTPLSYIIDWGPLGHHLFDSIDVIVSSRHIQLTNEQETLIRKWYNEKNKSAGIPRYSSYFGIGKGKNLIIIQVESLQNFVINKKVNGQEITPNLNRLLQSSIYFPNFYPQTAEGNSSDAELLVNASLYPVREGSTFFRFGHNEYPSLAKILSRNGYYTLALHGDEGSFWNRNAVYPNLGFESFKDIESFQQDDLIGMGLSDDSFFQQSIPMLLKSPSPFYAFYITLTSHTPYLIPENLQTLELPKELRNTYLGNYFQSIHYTDSAIGKFINTIQKERKLKDSVIVIYGDHDGIFYKDKAAVEAFYSKKIDKREWIRDYTPVPFLIYHPDIEGKTVKTVGGQIDALPTIAHIMGIERQQYEYFAMGKNLLEKSEQNGSAILLKGDYGEKTYITRTNIQFKLNASHEEMLDISELIIRSNYFQNKEQ